MSRRSTMILVLAATALGAASAAAQTTPGDLRDLVGARGAGGETQLITRGYQHLRTDTAADSKFSYWWNAAQGRCISVRTTDGRYAAIVETLPADCGVSAAAASSDEVPVIFAGSNGEGEVTYRSNNCAAYYDARGYRTRALPACSAGQVARADDAMARHRREQGFEGSVADHGIRAINLICYGEGERPGYDVKTGYRWDSRERRYVHETRTEYTRQEFDTEVQLQFHDRDGRIRLPSKLIPPIHSGGEDGWWPMSEVIVGPDKISGRYHLNGLNRPKVDIDRRSGHIRIDGLSDFRGDCSEIDDGQRRF